MYTIFTETDGRIELSLQVPPRKLTAGDARALLAALEPLVAALRARTEGAEQPGQPGRSRTETLGELQRKRRTARDVSPSMRPDFGR